MLKKLRLEKYSQFNTTKYMYSQMLRNNFENVYLFQESEFNSKIYFIHWANLTYGNNKINFDFLIEKNYKYILNNSDILHSREHNYIKYNKTYNFLPKTLDNIFNYRKKILVEKFNQDYDMGFIKNSLFGFNPHHLDNLNYSICNNQLKNKKSGVFIISSYQTKDVEYEIKKIKKYLKQCSYSFNNTLQFSKKIFYFKFYK